ncbi:MAG: AN1-type zinc finger domain-containing protein [Candidatus Bathyarchaeia archaeon]
MARCSKCGKKIEGLPPKPCAYCEKQFCWTHRLPENHECEGIKPVKAKISKRQNSAIKLVKVHLCPT